MKNLLLFTFLILFCSASIYGQLPIDRISGCTKVLNHPDLGFEENYDFAVFTGADSAEIDLVELIYGEGEPTTKWVKKKADENCISANPEDCLVWCLVEIPVEKKAIQVVLDKTQTTQFEMQSFSAKNILEMKGFFEEREILCRFPKKRMSRKICNTLQTNGYLTQSDCKMRRITDELAEALINFQTDNNLFIGGLSIESLDLLGIDY